MDHPKNHSLLGLGLPGRMTGMALPESQQSSGTINEPWTFRTIFMHDHPFLFNIACHVPCPVFILDPPSTAKHVEHTPKIC